MRLQGLEPLCCGSLVNQRRLRCAGTLELEGSPAMLCDPPPWCGEATTPLCGGCGDPHPLWRSSLVEPEIKVTVVESAEETLFLRSDTLSECFNNMDVSVPLWLNKPQDKSWCQRVCFLSSLLQASAFHSSNLCVPLLL